ncbi:MAG: HEPN domain-containing protein [Chloroflexi bacterium]|nr:HEPN domain-containing protein [Chloroflexota bacterium]
MSDPSNPLDWAAKAEEDYTLARSSLRRKAPLLYGAGFHTQQCAEKYLKALLVAADVAFPKTHDLVRLRALCLQAGIAVPVDEDALDVLSSLAVHTRYPGMSLSLEDVQGGLKTAQAVRRFARSLLGSS